MGEERVKKKAGTTAEGAAQDAEEAKERLVWVLRMLEEQAQAGVSVLRRGEKELTLADTGKALELIEESVALCCTMVKVLKGQAQRIRDREVAERGAEVWGMDSAASRLDTALEHLDYGQEGVMAGCHLIGVGRRELLRTNEEA